MHSSVRLGITELRGIIGRVGSPTIASLAIIGEHGHFWHDPTQHAHRRVVSQLGQLLGVQYRMLVSLDRSHLHHALICERRNGLTRSNGRTLRG